MKPLPLFDLTAIAQTAYAPETLSPQRTERVRFCTRCGTTDDDVESQLMPYGFNRVCERCGMGVMLTAPRKALPAQGASFVVVTREGRISAVSEAAQRFLGSEDDLVGMPITSSITMADGDEHFLRALARAGGGGREVSDMQVFTTGGRGRTLMARIASCGPPRAALLVLERSSL